MQLGPAFFLFGRSLTDELEPAPIDSEERMVSIEPYLDDRAQRERDEQREQMEDAMAKSRERRNQQLAK